MLGSQTRPLRVAIVGSGPSAFYAAEALFKAQKLFPEQAVERVVVDMFDRLPTPYGLVRGGVAPDHQKIKSVVKVYEAIAQHEDFRFLGNVMLGRDLSVEDLRSHYDQVIYAVGAESDRRLGIPGENLTGVHSATSFVGWYNGHPDHCHCNFELDRARRVAVVGNGNVAIDVMRILISKPERLAPTDIADYAIDALERSAVEDVLLLGRRGPAQAAFSPREIQEVADVEGAWLDLRLEDVALDPVSEAWLETAPRSAKRNVEFLQKHAQKKPVGQVDRRAGCMFCVSPAEFVGDDSGRVTKIRLQRSELVPDEHGVPRPKPAEQFEEHEVDLVLKAIGYRGVPIEGVPFDECKGVIANDGGRVLDRPGGEVVPGAYVVGWAKRGPTGLIGTNSPDSKETVMRMLSDLRDREPSEAANRDRDAVLELLESRGVDVVTFQDWRRLDAFEVAEGARVGKVRRKIVGVDEAVSTLNRLRDEASSE